MGKPLDLREWARAWLVENERPRDLSPEDLAGIVASSGESLIRYCAKWLRQESEIYETRGIPSAKGAALRLAASGLLRSFQLTKEGEDG